MPNAPVAAAATGLPALHRRSLILGTAAAAVTVAPATVAAEPMSDLAELIADHAWANEAAIAACEAFDALEASAELPKVLVRCGKRRFRNRETGEVLWGQWEFRFAFEIERHFAPTIGFWDGNHAWSDYVASVRAERDAALADLHRQEVARAEAEARCGLTAADEAADRACDERWRLRDAIIAYRPTTIEDVARKNAFLLGLLRDGHAFDDAELAQIFSEAET